MPHACFLASTTKNPIKRAIALGSIYAYKDNHGRWQIGEKTFLTWLSQRRAAERTSGNLHNQRTVGGSAWCKAKAAPQSVVPSTLISDKLSDLTRVEKDAWKHAPNVPADVRPIYINYLAMISDQKTFLKMLNQIT